MLADQLRRGSPNDAAENTRKVWDVRVCVRVYVYIRPTYGHMIRVYMCVRGKRGDVAEAARLFSLNAACGMVAYRVWIKAVETQMYRKGFCHLSACSWPKIHRLSIRTHV